MTAATPAPEKPRWLVAIGDALGFVAAIWAIPVAIIVVGLPIALLFTLARIAWRAL
jgi:hypothetical protein